MNYNELLEFARGIAVFGLGIWYNCGINNLCNYQSKDRTAKIQQQQTANLRFI